MHWREPIRQRPDDRETRLGAGFLGGVVGRGRRDRALLGRTGGGGTRRGGCPNSLPLPAGWGVSRLTPLAKGYPNGVTPHTPDGVRSRGGPAPGKATPPELGDGPWWPTRGRIDSHPVPLKMRLWAPPGPGPCEHACPPAVGASWLDLCGTLPDW